MIISNECMLSFFENGDMKKNYRFCRDIALAGKNHKINEIIFFAHNENDIDSGFICVELCTDSFAQIFLYSTDEFLINEAVDMLLKYDGICEYLFIAFGETEFSASAILENFEISEEYEAENPTYCLNSFSDIKNIRSDGDVNISLLTDNMVDILKSEINGNETEFSGWTFDKTEYLKDVKIYILRKGEKPCGYLRAECAYSNCYEIGWLNILPEFRRNGYASQLVSYFVNDCIKNNLIPYYGSAVCEESEKTAKKCGFSLNESPKYRKLFTKK